MKVWKFAKAAALTGIAALMLSGPVKASPLVISLFDPDPQPVNGTIPTAALSERTPGGTTPVMNDLTGQGYPDTAAYYNPDGKLFLPPPEAAPRDSRMYYHRWTPTSSHTVVHIVSHAQSKK